MNSNHRYRYGWRFWRKRDRGLHLRLLARSLWRPRRRLTW